jgi:hypothetical protein
MDRRPSNTVMAPYSADSGGAEVAMSPARCGLGQRAVEVEGNLTSGSRM